MICTHHLMGLFKYKDNFSIYFMNHELLPHNYPLYSGRMSIKISGLEVMM